jgi:hypothetical protein
MPGWGTIELCSEALEARVTAPDQGAEGQGQVPGDAGERSQQSVQGVPATRVGRRS